MNFLLPEQLPRLECKCSCLVGTELQSQSDHQCKNLNGLRHKRCGDGDHQSSSRQYD